LKYTFKHTLRACYTGFITQAVVNNLAPLLFIIFQDKYSISFEKLGRLVLINFGTQIIADYIAAKYADRIGYRKAAVLAHIFCAVGLICLGILPGIIPNAYTGLMIAGVIYAAGGGFIEVLISPIVDSLPGDAKASAMSLVHSFYCWGQMAVVLVTTLLLKALGADIWFILPVMWSLIPIYNLFQFLKVPLMPTVHEDEKTPLRELFRTRTFILALILMMCAGASELTMSQWSSLFAEKGLQVPKMIGDLLGPFLFALFMGLGRSLYGVFGHKINLRSALVISGALCVICYAVTIFVQIPVISLLGCAVCGLSVSVMWPGTVSLTAGAWPKGGTAMFGLLAIFGDLGAAVGPWLAGLISDLTLQLRDITDIGQAYGLNPDQLGLKAGLLSAIIFPIMLTVGVFMLRKKASADTL
jgi:fucose permease